MMQMKNEVYDVLKYVALVILPALGTLYFALSGIWGLPYGEHIRDTYKKLLDKREFSVEGGNHAE